VIQLLISILYNAALLLLLLLGLPWWALLLLFKSRFREGLSQRFFGVSNETANAFPKGPRIWIHAVSVGEVLAISGMVLELTKRAPEYSIVISTTTRTGQRLACDRFGESRCFYFPFDLPWAVATTLRRVSPAMLLLAESELWPNVLSLCHRRNVPVVVVNARVSDRSLPRYVKLRALWNPFLKLLTLVFSQTEQDADRLRQIGVPADRVRLGGNLKFDIRAPEDIAVTALLRAHLSADMVLFVCGSTLDGEEAMLLSAWPEVIARVPNAIMLVAPRHPERFDAVAALLAASPHSWIRRSRWTNDPEAIPAGSIFLLDSIGELASLYALARVAFVGGSLVPAGGHNPLEPAQFGVPIVMGPHYQNFRVIADLLLENHAMAIVEQAHLAPSLTKLLLNAKEAAEMGANAKLVFVQQAGATVRCTEAVLDLLRKSAARDSA
jgi:3-deoxy-D-manno-octulosonic-acid transferase